MQATLLSPEPVWTPLTYAVDDGQCTRYVLLAQTVRVSVTCNYCFSCIAGRKLLLEVGPGFEIILYLPV